MTALSGQSKELCGPPPDVSKCEFGALQMVRGGLSAAGKVGGQIKLGFIGEITEEMTKASFWIKPENRTEIGKSLCKGGNTK